MPEKTYPGPETIQRFELANGIVVLAYENWTAESVVVEGLIRAGSLVETRENAGLANFTAEMLMRGTERRTFDALYEALESVGASLGFSAGRHLTEFSATALAEDVDLVVGLLAEALREPVFPADEMESVRGEILTDLQIQANDTRHQAGRAFRELLYDGHPYSLNPDGYVDSVARLMPADLATFHHDYYGPQGMIITVVGAVQPEEVLGKISAAFGDWQPAPRTVPGVAPAARPLETRRTRVVMPQKTQTDIVLGLPGPLRSAPDYLEASLANTILGIFGMYGRLGATVREAEGLAYYVFSRLQGGLGPLPWYVSTGVAPDKVEQALESIRHEIDRLQYEPIPAEELADNKAFRAGSLPVSLETNDGLASIFTDLELFDLGLDYLQNLPDKIQAMTAESVQAAARKYFSSREVAIAVAGPESPAMA